MSEPDSAFFELLIPRGNLISWLDSPVRRAATWTDWREIGGTYHFRGGPVPIEQISDALMAEEIVKCDLELDHHGNNRDAVRWILDMAEAPYLRHCAYDDDSMTFTAGTLMFASNLTWYLQFLAIVRGAAAALEHHGTGVAVLHNYVWNPAKQGIAMRLGPGPTSRIASSDERIAAVGTFQSIADSLLAASARLGEDVYSFPDPAGFLDTLR